MSIPAPGKRRRHDRVAVVSCALVVFSLCADAEAASRSFRAELGVDEKYDDLALYTINQTTNIVTKKGDWISEPYLTLSYTTARRLPTKLVFDFTADIYATYSIQDYQTYRFLARQAIDEETSVAVKYTFIPQLFFGDDLVNSTSGNLFKDQEHEIHLVQVAADRALSPRMNLGLTAKYGVRNAKPAFSYRDYSLWGVSVDGTSRPLPKTKLSAGAAFEQDTARGGTNAFSGAPDDASYDQVSAYSGVTYTVTARWLLQGRYAYRWRDYTTSLSGSTGDTLHYGRQDSTNSLFFLSTYRIFPPLYLKAGYDSIWRDSTKSYARYHENIYTIGLNYRF
jgi:hypothetical protein